MNKIEIKFFPPIFENIFGNLNVRDLMNLRLVSRQFNEFLKRYTIKELVICNLDASRNNWFFANQPINHHFLIAQSRVSLLNSSIFNIKLRRLRIEDSKNCELSLEDLNQFSQLEHLEICDYLKLDKYTKLSLQHLKVLKVILGKNTSSLIELDTFSLQALHLDCVTYENVKFNCPTSIQYLSTRSYNDYFLIFENVECLKCNYYAVNLDWTVLLHYSKLKELHIQDYNFNLKLANLIKTSSELNKQNLKIYQHGLLVVDGEKRIDYNYDFMRSMQFSLFNNHTQTADSLDFIWTVDYLELMRSNNFNLPANFFQKFNAIQKILINGKVEDENQLIQFIKQSLNLRILYLTETRLLNQFYDELPRISALNFLNIHEDEEIELNFKFLNRMFNLIEFETNQQLNLKDKFDFNRLNFLKAIQFKIKRNRFAIKKLDRDRYNLLNTNYAADKTILEETKLNQIVNFFKTNEKLTVSRVVKNLNFLKIAGAN